MNIRRSMISALLLAAVPTGMLAGIATAAVPDTTYCTGNSNGNDVVIPDLGTATSPIDLQCAGLASAETHINVSIVHPHSGELVVDLISPDGTIHRLKSRNFAIGSLIQTYSRDFSYLNPTGTWTLRVTDTAAGNKGFISAFGMFA